MTVLSYSGDQFGYYTVGTSFRTYSKLLAIEEMRRTNTHLEWHFNQEQYSNFNWKSEPPNSLSELYHTRAQEIRDSYDYVVLWYSGGADSRCMLNAFIDNGIKVDEIANFIGYIGDNNKHSVLNEEIFFNAIPHVEQIKESYPDIVHRVVDITEIINSVYLRPDVKFEHIYNVKGIMSANSLARSYIRDYVPAYKKIIDSGKRMCFLWGAEKPRLTKINDKWHTNFIDVFSETNLRLQSLASQGCFDEWFFWAPTTAAIVAKQSHVLMKTMKLAESQVSLLGNITRSYLPKSSNGLALRDDVYHSLIYPDWNPNLIVAPKPQNLLLSERDNWFWKQNPKTNPAVKFAANGVQEMIKRLDAYWFNDVNDPTRGIKGCINSYALE